MQVKFWGVRGSIPTPATSQEIMEKIEKAIFMALKANLCDPYAVGDFVAGLPPETSGVVGGNTPCVQVSAGGELFILDAGSGLKGLGQMLMGGPFGQGLGRARMLISHTHWDHIQGFPFFAPAFMPGNRLEIYGSPKLDLKAVLSAQQSAPGLFPIAFEELPAVIIFHKLPRGPLTVGEVTVDHFTLRHPGESLAFRIKHHGKSLIYATDLEFADTRPETLAPFLEFIQAADLLIFDAQYTFLESVAKEGWGHSTSVIGVELAVRAGVKKLRLFHHEPSYDDFTLYEILEKTTAYYQMICRQGSLDVQSPLDIQLAVEGMEINL